MSNANNIYLLHQKGLALLWLWMDQWHQVGGWTWQDGQIHLTPLAAQRFVVGAPKRAASHQDQHLFLGAQADELAWLRTIAWSKVVWDGTMLWMLAPSQKSPHDLWPDLPAVTLGIPIRSDAFVADRAQRFWDVRGIWWDEENRLHIDQPVLSAPFRLGSLSNHWTPQDQGDIKTLRDVIYARLRATNVEQQPAFLGEAPMLSEEQIKLVQPFEKPSLPPEEKIRQELPQQHPELFGQFLEPSTKTSSR